jgi:acetyl-CoA carboxylase biotin carboxyl carrier protein
MPLTDEDVREILRIIDESELAELHIETDGFALHVRRGPPDVQEPGPPRAATGVAGDGGRARTGPTPPTPAAAAKAPPLAEKPGDPDADALHIIPAPMLGTFYRAEAPGRPPFVEVGSRVDPDTIVCIIEVMKMMNSVPAGVSGTITEICSENAELVEYGQPLFRVQPA